MGRASLPRCRLIDTISSCSGALVACGGVSADRDLVASAKAITERELVAYSARTVASQAATDRARKVLPLGVPSSFQAYDPHPIVVRHASGCRMIDVDGNEYVDYDM